MVSPTEQRICQLLPAILAGLPTYASIGDSAHVQQVLIALEYYLPEVVGEIYSEWKHERLDGVLPVFARKTGESEIEILGACIIISDQTVTPLHIRLQVAASGDEVSWLECRLGEQGHNGMVRSPYDSLHSVTKRLYALDGRQDLIEWCYKVTFGERRI